MPTRPPLPLLQRKIAICRVKSATGGPNAAFDLAAVAIIYWNIEAAVADLAFK